MPMYTAPIRSPGIIVLSDEEMFGRGEAEGDEAQLHRKQRIHVILQNRNNTFIVGWSGSHRRSRFVLGLGSIIGTDVDYAKPPGHGEYYRDFEFTCAECFHLIQS
jgi:hypothetical protein